MLHVTTTVKPIVLRHWLFLTENIFDFKNTGGADVCSNYKNNFEFTRYEILNAFILLQILVSK